MPQGQAPCSSPEPGDSLFILQIGGYVSCADASFVLDSSQLRLVSNPLPGGLPVAHSWPMPPSMLSSTPVMYDASSEARKITPLATSSDSPRRFIGTCWAKPSANCFAASGVASFLPKIGVEIGPGATAFTRILRPSSSAASVRVSDRSAALLAA